MQVQSLNLPEVLLITLDVHKDERGFFTERFHYKKFNELGLPANFVQDNHSYSQARVLRGLHFQNDPGQGKLVGVIAGKIFDVAVDIRPESPNYLKFIVCELDAQNPQLLWIPAGFAHGFYVLGNQAAHVQYKVTEHYNPNKEQGIRWNDPQINIPWPDSNPLISPRDSKNPILDHKL